jgi:hypothetical protein
VTTPSGQTCLAKKVSIDDMLTKGILSDADALTASITQYTRTITKGGPKGEKTQELDMGKMLGDTEAMGAIIGLADKALPHIVVSPVVKLHYTRRTIGKTVVQKSIPPEDREQGVVYTDQIDFGDKMWLFEWAVGDMSRLLSFRGGSADAVAGVVDGTKSPRPAKRASRRK